MPRRLLSPRGGHLARFGQFHLDQMMAAATCEAAHHMERGVDGRTVDRIEIGLRTVGRMVMNEPERASSSAHRDRRHPAIGASGDVAERPGGVEQAALARIAICEADAPVGGIVGDARKFMRAAIALGPMR